MYAISDMMRLSLAQFLVVFVVAALFACFVGQEAGYTSLMSGLAYAIPTAFLALYLALPRMIRGVRRGPRAVLVGEIVKILVVLALMGLMVKYYENLHWPAFIFTVIAVVNSYFVLLFKKN